MFVVLLSSAISYGPYFSHYQGQGLGEKGHRPQFRHTEGHYRHRSHVDSIVRKEIEGAIMGAVLRLMENHTTEFISYLIDPATKETIEALCNISGNKELLHLLHKVSFTLRKLCKDAKTVSNETRSTVEDAIGDSVIEAVDKNGFLFGYLAHDPNATSLIGALADSEEKQHRRSIGYRLKAHLFKHSNTTFPRRGSYVGSVHHTLKNGTLGHKKGHRGHKFSPEVLEFLSGLTKKEESQEKNRLFSSLADRRQKTLIELLSGSQLDEEENGRYLRRPDSQFQIIPAFKSYDENYRPKDYKSAQRSKKSYNFLSENENLDALLAFLK